MSTSTIEYIKAVTALEKALSEDFSDIVRDASIQRFEFCIELAWKVSKKQMGTLTSSPKQVIREMAQAGLISEVKIWLLAVDKRNLSVHTYNEELANEVFKFISDFFPHLKELSNTLTQRSAE